MSGTSNKHEIPRDLDNSVVSASARKILSMLESDNEPTDTVLTVKRFGVEMTPELLEDFNNPHIEGLVFRVVRSPFIQRDDYRGWYDKTYWGQSGAGLYTHVDTVGLEEYVKLIEIQGHVAYVTPMRLCDGLLYDTTEPMASSAELILSDEILDAHCKAVARWKKLSADHPMDLEKKQRKPDAPVTGIRSTRFEYFEEVDKYMTELRKIPIDQRPKVNLEFFNRLSANLPHVDVLNGESPPQGRDYHTHNNLARFGPNWANEIEIFALFLEELGYDGIYHLFNGNRALVTWNLSKIGTDEVWRTRLNDK